MGRRRFQLIKEQVQELTYAYTCCKDGPTRTRYQAVRLYGTGYPVEEVMEITGCSRPILMEWCRKYRAGGIAALADQRVGGTRACLLPEQIAQLKARLHLYTLAELFGKTAASAQGQFWTVPDLRRAMEQWYGVSYQSPSSYLRYLDLCGFSYQRPTRVYKSRKEHQVAEFEAQQTVILAQDEASMYLQATTSAVWALRSQTPVVRVHPGREKVNFYGTLNLHTGQEVVMRAEVMNATATAQHLKQVLQAIPEVSILLLWDRGPWHFGPPIRAVLAAKPRLAVMHFPVAAPDLNPQEHVRKATRRAISHNHAIPRLPELADRFENHLNSTLFESSFLEHYGFYPFSLMFN